MAESAAFVLAAAVVLTLPTRIDSAFWSWRGHESPWSARLFYACYGLLYVRDWIDCYLGNLSPKRGLRKPCGYPVRVYRRPRWCPSVMLALAVKRQTQLVAFGTVVAGAFVLSAMPSARQGRLVVAIASTLVELRFHAALGWHRCVMSLWTLWSYVLPPSTAPTARWLVAAHSYAGSGICRLRVARTVHFADLAAEARAILEPARFRSLFPRLVDFLLHAPDAVLGLATAVARIGFELFAVLALPPLVFRLCAVVFHQVIAVATSIDFLENKVVLLATLVADDLRMHPSERQPERSALIAARCFALFLLWPVFTMREDFPMTPNALFPFSARQMRTVEELTFRVEASHGKQGPPFDLIQLFLQRSDAQPAQLYHREVWLAADALRRSACEDSALDSVADTLAGWLYRDYPLFEPHNGALRRLDNVTIRDARSLKVFRDRRV